MKINLFQRARSFFKVQNFKMEFVISDRLPAITNGYYELIMITEWVPLAVIMGWAPEGIPHPTLIWQSKYYTQSKYLETRKEYEHIIMY